FQQGHLLAELQAPLLEGYAPPDWVRPPCGSCAASGIKCTGGDFLHGVRCDNCNDQKKPCGFDLSIPRMTSLSALSAAADAAPERISSLIVDSLMLRGMTRVAFALAEDQYKLLEAKMGTLSLILSRVYSDEGDAGLRRYFHDIEALQNLLEFSWHVPLDTPMLYPRRASTSTMGITQEEYTWTTTFDEGEVDEYLSSLKKDMVGGGIWVDCGVKEDIEGGSMLVDPKEMSVGKNISKGGGAAIRWSMESKDRWTGVLPVVADHCRAAGEYRWRFAEPGVESIEALNIRLSENLGGGIDWAKEQLRISHRVQVVWEHLQFAARDGNLPGYNLEAGFAATPATWSDVFCYFRLLIYCHLLQ
ncbi:hypothetical protein EST38_g14672, partial [Candolleomyces aberdarensis]